jgi:hypothetical protein
LGGKPDDDGSIAREHQVEEDYLEDRERVIESHGRFWGSWIEALALGAGDPTQNAEPSGIGASPA